MLLQPISEDPLYYIIAQLLCYWYCFIMQNDRVKQKRENKIGKIEVVRYTASFSHCEFRPASDKSHECKFKQANKKDVSNVIKSSSMQSTDGEQELHTMATTRRGRYIRDSKPYDRPEHAKRKKADESPPMVKKRQWNRGEEVGRLVVEYHMTNTLQDWNIQPKRPDWPKVDLGTVVID